MKLKEGVSIVFRKKTYIDEIPDTIIESIYKEKSLINRIREKYEDKSDSIKKEKTKVKKDVPVQEISV